MTNRKAIATTFLQLAASGRAGQEARTLLTRGFRHHNAHFDAKPESLLDAMDANAQQFPGKRIDVKLALEDGDHVAIFSHVRRTASEPGFALVHIFRFEGDRIAELWDLAQEVPANSPNANGMF